MRETLQEIRRAFPHSLGHPTATTAADIIRAARLRDQAVTVARISEFLVWKFGRKRPAPYDRNGIQEWGGVLTMTYEDFPAWLRSTQAAARSSEPERPTQLPTTVELISDENEKVEAWAKENGIEIITCSDLWRAQDAYKAAQSRPQEQAYGRAAGA